MTFFIRKSILFLIALALAFPASFSWAEAVSFSIHVGSFQEAENAAQAVSSWRAKGFESFSRLEDVPGKGMYHRVYVGRYSNPRDAERSARSLSDRGLISYYVVKAVPGGPLTATADLRGDRNLGLRNVQNEGNLPDNENEGVYGDQPPLNEGNEPYPPPAESSAPPPPPPPPPANNYDDQYEYRPSAGPDGNRDFKAGPWSVSLKTGWSFWSNSDDFKISRTSGGVTTEWTAADDDAFFFAISPSYKINNMWSVEASFERPFPENFSLWYLTVDPKVTFPLEDGATTPYVKAGLIYGSLTWNGAPGEFSGGWGWETGVGVDVDYDRFIFGTEFLYRRIGFDWEPDGSGATSKPGDLDLSGYSLMGFVGYTF